MKNSWKKLSSKIVYKNSWYYIRKDKVIRPDGKKGEYNVVVKPSAVFIVALDEEQNVYLVKLYRYTNSINSLEIPGGGSENQRPLIAAKRELQEETGLIARKWRQLGKIQTANGILSQYGYIFLAKDLQQTLSNAQEEEGIAKVLKIPLKEALIMIQKGKITDAQTIVALHLASYFLSS